MTQLRLRNCSSCSSNAAASAGAVDLPVILDCVLRPPRQVLCQHLPFIANFRVHRRQDVLLLQAPGVLADFGPARGARTLLNANCQKRPAFRSPEVIQPLLPALLGAARRHHLRHLGEVDVVGSWLLQRRHCVSQRLDLLLGPISKLAVCCCCCRCRERLEICRGILLIPAHALSGT